MDEVFKVGDFVARGGDDVHVISSTDDGWKRIQTICILPGSSGYRIGDWDTTAASRWHKVFPNSVTIKRLVG